jgi:hypothetical protein
MDSAIDGVARPFSIRASINLRFLIYIKCTFIILKLNVVAWLAPDANFRSDFSDIAGNNINPCR